jgi:hypothetical protein
MPPCLDHKNPSLAASSALRKERDPTKVSAATPVVAMK